MELGEKLKQARLEAGLSQRQLCGDTITRNMLSQIENGSAKPSFATLQALAARLGKPVSYFWEQAPSENLGILYRAAQLPPEQSLNLLEDYLTGDPILDAGYDLLRCHCQLSLAEQALGENRVGYAGSLLEQAEQSMTQSPKYQHLFEKRLLLLRFLAGEPDVQSLSSRLPDNTEEMLLRATAALAEGNSKMCIAFLSAADRQTEKVLLLQGDAYIALRQYEQAISCFDALPHTKELYPKLELCYRELGNYEKAYHYACLQR